MNKDNNKKWAIYSRKSKFTGKGDSVGNQVELCKKHLQYKYNIEDIEKEVVVYEDEGFTGYNTRRPQFQSMINDIKNKKIKGVCCYKLDRISRNVSDFANMKDTLQQYDVSFISITENFDTSTPLGTAMLMIASVFAQLERDTIAERIRDNMLELAKTGRWLGGTTPTGFKSEKVKNISIDGKERSLFKLTPIKDEIDIIKNIYIKYKELKSQTKLETYLIQHDIKTKNNIDFSRFAIKNILQNPVYVVADKDIYNYFLELGVEIYADEDKFNGKYGLMVYNKTEQIKGKTTNERDIQDWIISVGMHKGIISGKEWIEIQELIEQNGNKRYRKPTKNNALLSGLIRCSHCGSYMRPKLKNYTNKEGQLVFNYMCELKEKSRKSKCTCPNVSGNEVDSLVMNTVKELIAPTGKVYKKLIDMSKGKYKEEDKNIMELRLFEKTYKQNEEEIQNYISKILYLDGEALNRVNIQIKELKDKNKEIYIKINEVKNSSSNSNILDETQAEIILNIINTYFTTFDSLSLEIKRTLLRALIHSVKTDGETLFINFFNENDGENNTSEKKFVPQCEDSK
ncbi:MAG: recombinase family protein [Bacilli bacterium]